MRNWGRIDRLTYRNMLQTKESRLPLDYLERHEILIARLELHISVRIIKEKAIDILVNRGNGAKI